jgi:hypothetical protein
MFVIVKMIPMESNYLTLCNVCNCENDSDGVNLPDTVMFVIVKMILMESTYLSL